ncbi:MAG TPA: DUF3043 domain-containing protein [Actinomycetes bacterium]|nr:DUF3043 domain-containing protein [Actinomycetes bacterium]
MFRRSSTDQAPPTPDPSEDKSSGKGRPTPKRREAEAARRGNAAPPKDRKSARNRLREERTKERQKTATALRSGDERHYPARDQGPARHIARNWVDGRRNVGEFFWPVVIVALVFLLVPVPTLRAFSTLLLLGFYVVVMGDTAWSLLGLRNMVQLHVADPAQRRGALPYAFGRSLQSRKRRLPTPQVERGWTKSVRSGETKPL